MVTDEQFQELKNQFDDLKQKVDLFEDHQHLGKVVDGSKEFQGETNFYGRRMILAGGVDVQNRGTFPFIIRDGRDQTWLQPGKGEREVAFGMNLTGEINSQRESVEAVFLAAKYPVGAGQDAGVAFNRLLWENRGTILVRCVVLPQDVAGVNGPSVLPPNGFVTAARTPSLNGFGTISEFGFVLTDADANFQPANILRGSMVSIFDPATLTHIATFECINNTSNTITFGYLVADNNTVAAQAGSFLSPTGTYYYEIATPVLLGGPNEPFARLFVSSDIRMGFGPSSGLQPRFIKWGAYDPNGVVVANIGSMFLNFVGVPATLYIKEAGDGLSTGWVAK